MAKKTVKKPAPKESKKKASVLNFNANCSISVLKQQVVKKNRGGKNITTFEDRLKIADMNNSAKTIFLDAKATAAEIGNAVKEIVFE